MKILKIALIIFLILVIGGIISCIIPGFDELFLSLVNLFGVVLEVVIVVVAFCVICKIFMGK